MASTGKDKAAVMAAGREREANGGKKQQSLHQKAKAKSHNNKSKRKQFEQRVDSDKLRSLRKDLHRVQDGAGKAPAVRVSKKTRARRSFAHGLPTPGTRTPSPGPGDPMDTDSDWDMPDVGHTPPASPPSCAFRSSPDRDVEMPDAPDLKRSPSPNPSSQDGDSISATSPEQDAGQATDPQQAESHLQDTLEDLLGEATPPARPGLLRDWTSRYAYLGGDRWTWWGELLEDDDIPLADVKVHLPVCDEHPFYEAAVSTGDADPSGPEDADSDAESDEDDEDDDEDEDEDEDNAGDQHGEDGVDMNDGDDSEVDDEEDSDDIVVKL